MDDFEKLINASDLIEWIMETYPDWCVGDVRSIVDHVIDLPSAEPEISRIEQELHGKTPEEQYEFLYWLLLKFGLAYTDSRLAVIEWLRGERNE